MAVTETTPYVSYIQDSSQANHPIAAPYAILNKDGETPTYVSFDNLSLGVDYTVAASLPTASSAYKGKIYLISDASDVEGGSYIEYICVNTSGTTWAWEPIGTTKINVSVSSVSTSKDTVAVTYDKVNANTGNNTKTTISGSNFTFGGTAATITVPAHSHTMGGTTKYLTKSNVPATFGTTNVVRTLKTESITQAGAAETVVTGYTSPTTVSVLTGVTGTVSRYKTQQITPTNGSETVATAGESITVATGGISGYSSPTKAALATTSISYNTDAIKSYPGAFSKLTTAQLYPAANVNAVTSVTGTTATLASRVGSTVMNGATVSADGILSFNSTTISGNVVSAVSTSTTNVRGTSVTYATGAAATNSTGAQFMTGLGTAVAATKATTTVATGGVTTGTQFLTGLGTATAAGTTSIIPVSGTVSVAKAGSAVTVVTTGTTTSGGFAVITGVSGNGTTDAITALGTPSTADVATVGASKTVVTGADNTAAVYNSIATNASVFSGVSDTTATGAQAVITALNTNTGNKAAVDIAYTPAGTISGTQDVPAHSHSIGTTSASASVTVTGHTHTVTLSGGSVN